MTEPWERGENLSICHRRSRAPGCREVFSQDWWIGSSLWNATNFTTLPISFISGAPLWPFRQFVFVIVAYSLTQWQVPWSLEINSCQGHSFFSWAALSFTTHTTMRPRVRKPTLWDPPVIKSEQELSQMSSFHSSYSTASSLQIKFQLISSILCRTEFVICQNLIKKPNAAVSFDLSKACI